MLRCLLPALLPAIVAPYWPSQRGEVNGGCASQRSGPASLAYAASAPLAPALPNASSPFALSPLVGPSGTVYAVTGAQELLALAGDTLALLAALPLPAPALAAPFGLQLQPDGSLWVNGLGLLQGGTLTLVQGSALVAALAIAGAPPAGATTLAALEPCAGGQCLVVRSLVLPAAGGAVSVTCASAPLNFRTVLAAVRSDDAVAYFVLEDSGADGGTALVSLDLATCATAVGERACVGGSRTVMAPFFSDLLVDVCTSAGGSVQVSVLSAASVAAPQRFAVVPAAPGFASGGACTAAPPASPAAPASAALYANPANNHALLLLSCALAPAPPAAPPSAPPPTPFLFAFDLSANASAAAQLWATPLPQGLGAAALRGLAIDRAGTVFGAAAPRAGGAGGMLAFAAATGALLAATPCCDAGGAACPNCAVYGQPAIGLDGTLYAYQAAGGGGAWGALATFQAPLPPALSAAARSDLQRTLAAVGGVLAAAAAAGACWSARARCRSSSSSSGSSSGGGSSSSEGRYSQLRGAEAGGAAPAAAAAAAAQQSVAEMRAQLSARGVSHAHCVEKAELRELLRQSDISASGGGGASGAVSARAQAPRFTRRFQS